MKVDEVYSYISAVMLKDIIIGIHKEWPMKERKELQITNNMHFKQRNARNIQFLSFQQFGSSSYLGGSSWKICIFPYFAHTALLGCLAVWSN